MYCFVLHIGIYLYCTNSKETHKSCVCFNMQIPDHVECLVVFNFLGPDYVRDTILTIYKENTDETFASHQLTLFDSSRSCHSDCGFSDANKRTLF